MKPLPFASRNGYCRTVRGLGFPVTRTSRNGTVIHHLQSGVLWDWSTLDVFVRSGEEEENHDADL
jgi:hypothetical protein